MSGELLRLACGVIVTGFDGNAIDAPLADFFAQHAFAGYVLFARNAGSPEALRALTDSLRALDARPHPPLIAVDQEGGRVARLREGVETLPPMMTLGAANDESLARKAGEQLAFDLRRHGINVNFAPVADLAVDARNTVIGSRAFAADPAAVTDLAGALLSGLRRGGVAGTLKHFPGHGSTHGDSHLELPRVDVDATSFMSRDIVPFARLAANAPAIMSAHVVVDAIDAGRPATLSSTILTDILRGGLGFTGCCFTDCMQMDAIARGIGTIEGTVAAIRAGADAALVSHDPRLAFSAATAIADAVERGDLALQRLEEAYCRVESLRRSVRAPISLSTPSPAHGLGRAIARRGVTLVRGNATADPRRSIVVSFDAETFDGAGGSRDNATFADEWRALPRIDLALDPEDGEVRRAIERIASLGERPVVLMRRAHLYDRQARAVGAIARRFRDTIVVSMREPFDVACVADAPNVLAAYGDDAASMGGLADVLFGGAVPKGRLPVSIPA